MSLFRKLERRDYGGGVFTNPLGLPPDFIPTNGQLAYLDGRGGSMSSNQAMRHWAVWACIRIIADVISTLPIDAYDRQGNEIEPLPPRLVTPSAYATALQWKWQVLASVLLRGNAYGMYASFDRLEYPTQVDIISPDCVYVKKNAAGKKVFDIGGEILTTDQVWHLPGPQMPGELAGMSPIRYAARTITLGLDAEKFGADYYQNGIFPTAVLESDQLINGDQAKEMKERVRQATASRDMAVLGAGLKLNPYQIAASDSMFLETQRLNAASIAQIFGVPPEMIGAAPQGRTLTYANREQRAQDFLVNAINPWIARLEESLTAWFPRGTYVKFNTGALLRSDLITRYQAYQIGIRNNFVLPSEARELEDMPNIPGLDDKELPTTGGGSSSDSGSQGQGTNDSNQG